MKQLVLILTLLSFAMAQAPDAIGSLYQRDMSGSLQMVCTVSLVDGSGLGLEGPVLLTAAHCVDSDLKEVDEEERIVRSNRDYLVTFDERSYNEVHLIRVGDTDAGYDAAVLKFVEFEPEAEPLLVGGWGGVQVGDPIVNWANPAGLGLQRFTGEVTMLALNRPVEAADINWRGNAVAILPSAGGSSGSLILDASDRVVGVLVGGITPQRSATSFTVFVPILKVLEMVSNDRLGMDVQY